MRATIVSLVALLALAFVPARAQVATIIYHHVGDSAGSFMHRRWDDPRSVERDGLPREIEVPDNGRLCFDVRGANPVLYRYVAGASKIEDKGSQGFADLATALRALAGLPDLTKAAVGGGASLADDYADAVGHIYNSYQLIVRLRRESDRTTDFRTSAAAIATQASDAQRYVGVADSIWREGVNSKDAVTKDEFTKKTYMLLLREQQTVLFKQAQAIANEFSKGLQSLAKPVCVDGSADPQRVVLSIKYVGSDSSIRSTGDSVVTISTRAVSTLDFESGAGITMFARPRGHRVIRTDASGNLESVDDLDTPVRPMFFLMGRVRNVPWLWATIGFTADKSGLSNLTVGPVMRTGIFGHGPHLTIGAGYGLARVPVGLKSDTLVGRPVPPGQKLDDLIERKLRGSVSVMVLISGLKP
jgi:hypothetical protein